MGADRAPADDWSSPIPSVCGLTAETLASTCATESETAPRAGGHCKPMDRPQPEQDPPVAWQTDRAKVVCNGYERVDGASSLPSCCTTSAQVRRSPHGVRCSLSLR